MLLEQSPGCLCPPLAEPQVGRVTLGIINLLNDRCLSGACRYLFAFTAQPARLAHGRVLTGLVNFQF